MSRIMIVGGGGFGLEMYGYLTSYFGSIDSYEPAMIGILDDNPECEVVRKIASVQYFGGIQAYQPKLGDAVTITSGNVTTRLKIAEALQARGARLLTYIHPTALIAKTAVISKGAIICPYSIVNADAHVGENVVVNVFCSIGHGANVGAHSVLSPYCTLSGDSVLGEAGYMGTRATLFPKVVLGANCVVDAHSPVKQSTPDRKIITMRGQYLVYDNRGTPKGLN
jgi:sugar O-acyltransferase (sialic acid O-acetyltransferase NeuD family)